jgi:hypothetical protein
MSQLPANATEKQVLQYLSTFKGTVTQTWIKENPTLLPFAGMTATQVYQALKTANPKATPLAIGRGVTEIWIGGGLSGAISGVLQTLGLAVQATDTGIAKTQFAPVTLGDFLSALSSANTWIRVAKVAIGGTIVIVGLAKLTGADKSLGGITAKAVKAAPLL